VERRQRIEKRCHLRWLSWYLLDSYGAIKITLSEKTVPLNVLITGYPSFSAESVGKKKFESKQAGLTFEFNESLSGF
jgi:hypothetical protein